MASISINNTWHPYQTSDLADYVYKRITGTLTATYSGTTMNVSFSGSQITTYVSEGGYPDTNNRDTISIYVDNTLVTSTTAYMFNGTYSISLSGSLTVGLTTHTVTLRAQCGDYVSCPYDYHDNPCIVGTLNMDSPYSAHTYSINSITPTIGIYNSTTYTVNYTIRGGTNSLSWVRLYIYDTSNNLLRTISCGTSTGSSLTQTFVASTGCTDGTQYRVSIGFYDNQYTYETSKLSFYTYRTPIINSVSLSSTSFSGFGNVTLNWATNTRRWSSNPTENAFQTYIRFGTDNTWFSATNHSPTSASTSNATSSQSQTITQSIINSHFSTTQRSNSSVSTTIQMRRTNPSSGVSANSSTVSITVQFAPKYAPNQINYWDYDSSNSYNRGSSITAGTTCYLDEHPQIVIDWSIPDSIDRGIIDGYELYIYTDSTYSTIYKTFTINVGDSSLITDTYGQYVVDIRDDLIRGQMNYVGVRAFYNNPSNTKMYGPELQQEFILPIGKLAQPVISYPINDSQWHNNNFRILFELPEDDDYDVLDEYIQNDTYEYKEIVVTINNTEYKYSENPNIFSINKMGYKYKVCVNPSIISSFENVDTYTINVQVQKSYYQELWSELSDTVTLYNIAITRLDLQQDMLVLDTHYKYVQQGSIRLYNTYPINTLPSDNIDQNNGDIIYAKHYQAIFETILAIQDGVNEWARYDEGKEKCQFQQTIDKFSGTNVTTNDIITAIDDDRPTRQGRNYKNILIECMNKLY